jgi:hypothetical protein
MDCAVHPGVDAPYECSRCHEFVCTDCQVKVEGTLLCRSCYATVHRQFAGSYRIETRNISYPRGIAAGLLAAVVVGYVWAQLAAWIGYLLPFGVAVGGGAVGAAVVRGSGGKRSPQLQELAALIALLGGFVEWLLAVWLTGAPLRYGLAGPEPPLATALRSLPTYLTRELGIIDWVFLGLGVAWAWWIPHVRAAPE